MKEHITRQFFTENDEEEKNIHNILKLTKKMDKCLHAYILGEGDHHFINAIFTEKIIYSNPLEENK